MTGLRAIVNCDMGEGDNEALMQTIHLANVACGFHASDFFIMNETVQLAKKNNILIGAHPCLPDRGGWGSREMKMEPDELASCFIYQVSALTGFLILHGIKPHGAVYGMTACDINLAWAVVGVARLYKVPFMGLAGTCHQSAAEELSIPFIAEWFADLAYSAEGKLLITKKHDPVPLQEVTDRVNRLLEEKKVSSVSGALPLPDVVSEVSICCHSDTPGAVEIAQAVKAPVKNNENL
ncbi:LamB/YcsF family protein [Fomes fomentarius]|nr:LamB/YcsF family protein [Fomes fomentarius]